MVRCRYRHGYDQGSQLLSPDTRVECRIELGPTACHFAVGHRLRLEITSSCFPNHDRNHNTGGNDLWEIEMVTASNTVFHTAGMPSRLELHVLSC